MGYHFAKSVQITQLFPTVHPLVTEAKYNHFLYIEEAEDKGAGRPFPLHPNKWAPGFSPTVDRRGSVTLLLVLVSAPLNCDACGFS